ncbi:MAG: hypothetical protein H7A38_02805 [Chlamydiales bacterium]|nr:hypothetical protein [Chlamydiales bacterium]
MATINRTIGIGEIPATWDDLGPDNLEHILSWVPSADSAACSAVNHELNGVVSETKLLQKKSLNDLYNDAEKEAKNILSPTEQSFALRKIHSEREKSGSPTPLIHKDVEPLEARLNKAAALDDPLDRDPEYVAIAVDVARQNIFEGKKVVQMISEPIQKVGALLQMAAVVKNR